MSQFLQEPSSPQCGHLGGQAFNFFSSSFCQVFVMKVRLSGFVITINTIYDEILPHCALRVQPPPPWPKLDLQFFFNPYCFVTQTTYWLHPSVSPK